MKWRGDPVLIIKYSLKSSGLLQPKGLAMTVVLSSSQVMKSCGHEVLLCTINRHLPGGLQTDAAILLFVITSHKVAW